ncbi:MAG: hypothetical protein JST51_06335 [Armatimonadetes bacterium]|nr:hypothetical protein [Armatimonadota bacterium]
MNTFLVEIAQANASNDPNWAIVFLIFAFLGIGIWTFVKRVNYQGALDEFKADPTNNDRRRELFAAARSAGLREYQLVDMLDIIDQCDHPEKAKPVSKENLSSRLQMLSDLNRQGVISNDEYSRAKARLME